MAKKRPGVKRRGAAGGGGPLYGYVLIDGKNEKLHSVLSVHVLREQLLVFRDSKVRTRHYDFSRRRLSRMTRRATATFRITSVRCSDRSPAAVTS
ncbi:hypothetical protein JMJ56_08250 [Belnapia sp. T18]|uniref:Uncharacterized protein n=1 Tax=Belnapia arida TaxID=2804533 RepID=A0ABS1TZY8_9PROT|nr:hypothetical protein [Belnapia arida]MBL6077993.1 hypothetical protein [Belnapia arida]